MFVSTVNPNKSKYPMGPKGIQISEMFGFVNRISFICLLKVL